MSSFIGTISNQARRIRYLDSLVRYFFSLPPSSHQIPKHNVYSTLLRHESSLAKLRRKTGYAFTLCREALEKNDQDCVKAEKWLQAEAIKQGWEKAERIKSRMTTQGLIGIYTNPSKQKATIVEVQCETDFVASNTYFIELVSKLAKALEQIEVKQTSNAVEKVWIIEEEKLKEISGNLVIEAIQKFGENIKFIRGCIIYIGHSDSEIKLLPYAHSVASKVESNDKDILLGKYGTITALTVKKEATLKSSENDEIDTTQVSYNIEEIGSRLGQHIIGFSPKTVHKIEQVDQQEKNDVTDAIGDEEPNELLNQKFIFNDTITVEQYLKNSGAEVLDFIRLECGELI